MARLVHATHPCTVTHYVQLYTDDIGPLASNVARYLAEGLSRGEPALVIATPAHSEAFLLELSKNGCDVPAALRTGWLAALDANEALAGIMHGDRPDGKRFEQTIAARIRDQRAATGAAAVRGYGEMVGLLWNDGRTAAALQLEDLWNRRLGSHDLQLFCVYQIDVFGHEFQDGLAGQILSAHSAMISGLPAAFNSAVHRAAIDLVGTAPGGWKGDTEVPAAESVILWLRSQHPELVDEVLARARAATAPAASISKRAPSLATSRCLPG
jgi:hypothetical protein